MSPAHTATIRVRYAETDQMGVVYYANYFVWFEIGRVELMRSLGFDYRETRGAGRSASCRWWRRTAATRRRRAMTMC